MPKFTVKYACLVMMEATIEHDDPDDVSGIEGKLPGAYDGIPADLIPNSVETVEDYDSYWEVEETDEDAEVTIKKG